MHMRPPPAPLHASAQLANAPRSAGRLPRAAACPCFEQRSDLALGMSMEVAANGGALRGTAERAQVDSTVSRGVVAVEQHTGVACRQAARGRDRWCPRRVAPRVARRRGTAAPPASPTEAARPVLQLALPRLRWVRVEPGWGPPCGTLETVVLSLLLSAVHAVTLYTHTPSQAPSHRGCVTSRVQSGTTPSSTARCHVYDVL